MPSYDSDISLSLDLDGRQAIETAENLQNEIQDIFNKTSGQKMSASFLSLQNQMSKSVARAQQLKSRLAELSESQIPTEDYAELQKLLDTDTAAITQLENKMQKFLDLDGSKESNAFKKMRYDADELRSSIENTKIEMQQFRDAGQAFVSGETSAEYQRLATELDGVNNQMRIYVARANAQTEATNKSTKAIKSATTHTKGLNIHTGKIIKTFLRYAIGIRSLYVLFNKLRNAVKEGLANLTQYNAGSNQTTKAVNGLKDSLTFLKNSWGAAFAPIINYVAPLLTRLMDLLAKVAQSIGMFFARITGAKTFIKAIKTQGKYADAVKGVGSAAKEASRNLAEFDKLEVINSDKDTGGGGGADSGIGDMFEEVPIEGSEKWQKLLDNLKAMFDRFKAYVKKGFTEAWDRLNIDAQVEKFRKNTERMKNALMDIFSDPKVQQSAQGFLDKTAYAMGQTAASFVSIGLSLANNLVGGIAQYLEEESPRIKEFTANMFDIEGDTIAQWGNFSEAVANVMQAFESNEAIQTTTNIIATLGDVVMGTSEILASLGRDFTILFTQPIIDNSDNLKENLIGLFGIFEQVTGDIRRVVNVVMTEIRAGYDKYIKPVFEKLTAKGSELVAFISKSVNEDILPTLQKIIDHTKPFIDDYLIPILQTVLPVAMRLLGLTFEGLGAGIMGILKTLWTFLAKSIMPIIQGVWDLLLAAAESIIATIKGLWGIFEGLFNFIRDVFEVGWDEAWENMTEHFVDLWTEMQSVGISICNHLIDAVNGVFEGLGNGIQQAINALNSLLANIPDWVPGIGGGRLQIPNAYIPQIPRLQVPALADGAVIPPNKQFLAMLGDQSSGTNVEAPLSTIVDAVNIAQQDLLNATLQQNELLRQLLQKQFTVSARSVFDAVGSENDRYIRQTGGSRFAY